MSEYWTCAGCGWKCKEHPDSFYGCPNRACSERNKRTEAPANEEGETE